MTVLGARSFKDLFVLYDYYQIIIGRDQAVLDKYQDRYRDLQQTSTQIRQTTAELSEMKTNLQNQRERVVALQKEVDDQIATSGDAAAIQKLMDELTLYWENIGIYEVKRYFKALASAMQNLPTLFKSKTEVYPQQEQRIQFGLAKMSLMRFYVPRIPSLKTLPLSSIRIKLQLPVSGISCN